MKEISLTQGVIALVDDEDFASVSPFKWYANRMGHHYYAVRNVVQAGGRRGAALMHREILTAPAGFEVDHRRHFDEERIVDNRRSNLLVCTKSDNQHNRGKYKRGTSIFKGVCAIGRRWRADLRIKGKRIYLGCYEREVDAALVYDLAAVKHFGAQAQTNFPVPGSERWLFGPAEVVRG